MQYVTQRDGAVKMRSHCKDKVNVVLQSYSDENQVNATSMVKLETFIAPRFPGKLRSKTTQKLSKTQKLRSISKKSSNIRQQRNKF